VLTCDDIKVTNQRQERKSSEMEHIAEKASLVVQGVFIPMVGSFGLAGNLLALKLLRSKNLGIKATFRAVLTLHYGLSSVEKW